MRRAAAAAATTHSTPHSARLAQRLVLRPAARQQATRQDLLRTADLVRVGLAGTLASYRLQTHDGSTRRLDQIDYAGQPAGFASQPGEVVNYVENHDNQTCSTSTPSSCRAKPPAKTAPACRCWAWR
jgi:hypothetical protein